MASERMKDRPTGSTPILLSEKQSVELVWIALQHFKTPPTYQQLREWVALRIRETG